MVIFVWLPELCIIYIQCSVSMDVISKDVQLPESIFDLFIPLKQVFRYSRVSVWCQRKKVCRIMCWVLLCLVMALDSYDSNLHIGNTCSRVYVDWQYGEEWNTGSIISSKLIPSWVFLSVKYNRKLEYCKKCEMPTRDIEFYSATEI